MLLAGYQMVKNQVKIYTSTLVEILVSKIRLHNGIKRILFLYLIEQFYKL
jgi:hypothetical protein